MPLSRSVRVGAGPALPASAAAVLVVLLAAPARGQIASDPALRPTRGPLIVDAARAGDADATAVELNPGALGFVPASSLELVAAAADSDAVIPRRGAGLYWAAPIFGRSALGLGLTRVAGASAEGVDGHTTFRLAYALRPQRGLALGVAWAHLWDGLFGGRDTFDFGLAARAGRHLAFGATVEDVNQPRPPALTAGLARLWTAELALRPFGTDRLEVALGAAHADGDPWHQLVPRARLAARLRDGVSAYFEAQTVARGTGSTFGEASDTRGSLGLAIDFSHVGAAIGTPVYLPSEGSGGIGIAARVHVEAERRPALDAPAYVARVNLRMIDDDRAFVGLVRRLRALAVDPAVIGVLFKIDSVGLGYARVEEVRDLIGVLRARGKRTFAYLTFPSTRDYYLAAACDQVVIHPAGEMALTGIAQQVTFYKGAMDRLGVHLDLVRVGELKGAMEPFVMSQQSPDVRANKNQLLDDVFGRVTGSIAADRSRGRNPMDASGVRALIDRAAFTPEEAMRSGLVDGIVADADLEAFLSAALGRRGLRLRNPDPSPIRREAWPSRRVAVLLVDGAMVDGKSRELPFGFGAFAGSDTLVASLESCRRDPAVSAVVLRVNTPGGSAFASDVLAREIKRVRAAGKPVVVSMGDFAASGGYYISAPADVIFAEPSTVSGSIGVFGYKVDAEKLLGLLGISVETYRRGAHADLLSPYRPWTPEEIKIVEDKVRHLYDLFVGTVAEGRRARGLTVERVDRIGRGHVWTGALAQGLGLVDKLGGLSAALDEAARLGGVPVGRQQMPEIEVLPPPRSALWQRLAGFASSADSDSAGDTPGAEPETETETEAGLDPEAGLAEPPDDGGIVGGSSVAFAARLLTEDVRSAFRLLAPLLFGGAGTGFEARLPYDLELH